MAHKDFNVVLRFDTANPELFKSLREITKTAARDLITAARLVHSAQNDGTPAPEIFMYDDDYVMGKQDVAVEDDTKS